MDDFRFLEINGMKIPEPNQAFSQLWEFLSDGKKTTPRLALTQLENHFQQPDMNRSTTLVSTIFVLSQRRDADVEATASFWSTNWIKW